MLSKNSCTLFVLFKECCKNAGSSVPWISQLRTWAQTEYFTCSLHHVTFNASAISIQWPFCSFCLLVFLNVAFNKKCFIHSNVDIVEDVEKSTLYFAFITYSNKGHYESEVESPEVILDLGLELKKSEFAHKSSLSIQNRSKFSKSCLAAAWWKFERF